MGGLFGGLTNPGTGLQAAGGGPTTVGTPQQVLAGANQAVNQTQPAFLLGNNNAQVPGPNSLPKITTPSFQQAAQAGAAPGGANALSPGLSKAGKLMTLLTSGLQGALAGNAAQNQMIAQTGGRRAGGAGTGFEAGYQLPWQRAMQGQQLQQAQAQTALTQAQSQMVPTPYGQMPAGLAKLMFPAMIRAQGQENVQQMKGQTAEQVQQQKGESAQNVAQINKRFIPVEGVGLFDTQSRSVVPGTNQAVQITPEIAKDYDLPPEFLGKPMKLSDLNAFRFQNVPEMTAQGPIIINRNQGTAQPVQGPGGQRYSPPALANPRTVADVNNPGQTINVPAGQSFGMPGPQSASVTTPKAAMRAAVPSKIGDKNVAFTTAIQHADLLRQAARALQNGDVQTLSGLENAFRNEFGSTGPITAKTIANAYSGEVTDLVSKGHITDAEKKQVGNTLDPSKQSFAQVNAVLNAYQALAQSKMNMLGQQTKKAVAQSQPTPKKNANAPTGGGKVLVEGKDF